MGSLVCLVVSQSVLRGVGTNLEMQCVGRPWRVAVPFVLPDHCTSPVPHKARVCGRQAGRSALLFGGFGSTSAWVLVGGHDGWLMAGAMELSVETGVGFGGRCCMLWGGLMGKQWLLLSKNRVPNGCPDWLGDPDP